MLFSATAERIALSAHVVVSELESWPDTFARLQTLLVQRYGIEHVTLQGEMRPKTVSAAPIMP
jgi:cobalt-zinc-cadmium efflux system protein